MEFHGWYTLALSPKSTKLSIHFEISQQFVQKPKHMGTRCPAEWQAADEILRICLCREWLLGAIWQLHQIAICNITRGDVVLCLLYIGKKKCFTCSLHSDILPVVNGKFPISVILCLRSTLPALCCRLYLDMWHARNSWLTNGGQKTWECEIALKWLRWG